MRRPHLYPIVFLFVALVSVGLPNPVHALELDDGQLDALLEVAMGSWDAGQGTITTAESDRWLGAVEHTPGRVTELRVGTLSEFGMGTESVVGDWSGELEVGIDLGTRATLLRDALEARARATVARGDVERFVFLTRVSGQWSEAVVDRALWVHLQKYRDEVDQQLEPFRDAVAARTLSKVDFADLSLELARLDAEVARAKRAASDSQSQLEALLGAEAQLPDIELVPGSDQSPWLRVQEGLDQHPGGALYEAEMHAAITSAEAIDATESWELGVGVGFRRDPAGDLWLGPTLSLTIPLSETYAVDAALSRGGAEVSVLQASWERELLERDVRAMETEYETLRDALRALETRLLDLELARLELNQQALANGQITLERLARARRDFHEAQHEHLVLVAEIVEHELRAALLIKILEDA